jgi:hypothetical protein
MNVNCKVDFSRLLGFQIISDELAERVDFQGETFAGRLGAKVGDKVLTVLDLPQVSRSYYSKDYEGD